MMNMFNSHQMLSINLDLRDFELFWLLRKLFLNLSILNGVKNIERRQFNKLIDREKWMKLLINWNMDSDLLDQQRLRIDFRMMFRQQSVKLSKQESSFGFWLEIKSKQLSILAIHVNCLIIKWNSTSLMVVQRVKWLKSWLKPRKLN